MLKEKERSLFKVTFCMYLLYHKPVSSWWPCPPSSRINVTTTESFPWSVVSELRKRAIFVPPEFLSRLWLSISSSATAECSSLPKPRGCAEHHLQTDEKCPSFAHCFPHLTLVLDACSSQYACTGNIPPASWQAYWNVQKQLKSVTV